MSDTRLYRSITAEIECAVVARTLYIRSYKSHKQRGKWKVSDITIQEATHQRECATTRENQYYWGCIRACLMGTKESFWYVEPRSNDIRAQIAKLQKELKAELKREANQMPKSVRGGC